MSQRSPSRHPGGRRLLVVCVMTALAGACDKPATISFQPPTKLVIETEAGAAAPAVVAFTEAGKQLETAPPTTLSLSAQGIVSLERDRLVPLKNGKVMLIATAPELPPAQVPVIVQIIDEFSVLCPEPCAVRVGETLPLAIKATGLGEPVNDTLTWATDNPSVATVAADGKLTGVAAGTVTITARMASKTADIKVKVKASIDELRMVCPWPPLIAMWKSGVTTPPLERSCEVAEGQDVTLTAVVSSAGAPLVDEPLEWKSTDPSVRVRSGVVTGDRIGGAMVEVRAGDVAVEMPVSVQKRASGQATCPTSDDAYANNVTAKINLSSASAATFAKDVELRCSTAEARGCIEDGVGAIGAGVQNVAIDARVLEDFAMAAIDEKARRCCCRR